MKALVTIIILALIGWGIWALVNRDGDLLDNQEAQVGGALNDDGTSQNIQNSGDNIDLGEFEDKG